MSEVRYEALELSPGRYWFCAREIPSQRLWPVGYCADKVVCPECRGTGGDERRDCIVCLGKCVVRSREPCQGHYSEVGARGHWLEWLVDSADMDGVGEELRLCADPDCSISTRNFARVLGREEPLCSWHRNRQTLLTLLVAEAAVIGEAYGEDLPRRRTRA